jgi:type IV secretion system protein VirB2
MNALTAPAVPLSRRLGAGAFIVLVLTLGIAEPALAQDVEGFLQNVVDLLTGNAARLLAIIAIVVVGICWMFGLFDLRRAAIVILGIIVVFGAAEIADMITGGGA